MSGLIRPLRGVVIWTREFLKPQESRATKIAVKSNSQQQVSVTQVQVDSIADPIDYATLDLHESSTAVS